MDNPEAPSARAAPHTAFQCLEAIALRHGVDLSAEKLAQEHGATGEPSSKLLVKLAHDNGLRARAIKIRWKDLPRLGKALPAIARLTNGNSVVVANFLPGSDTEPDRVAVLDPLLSQPGVLALTEAEFTTSWRGEAILVSRRPARGDELQPFGLRWFLTDILRQGHVFRDIAIAAVCLHVLALGMPVFTQIVIDKVVSHRSYSTLYVVSGCIIGVVIFEALFTALRGYLLQWASMKIDARLAERTFNHLLSLPLPFFEHIPAGVLVKHMQLTDKIRQFLTGRVFLTAIDATAVFIFLPLMIAYSPLLTAIVVGASVLIGLVVVTVMGPFRRSLRQLYAAEADRQALLVESIQGMRTVKSLAIEPAQARKWGDAVAAAVMKHFRVGSISAWANAFTTLIEKLMLIVVVVVGTTLVFGETLTIGALIAFQMLSGRLTSPFAQLAGLIHEYQEVALSVQMLGVVMNTPPERNVAGGLRPDLHGAVKFQDVTFRYAGSVVPALSHVSFDVRAGTVVGIVGRSGSGKTTITRLIQGVYQADEGLVRMDANDIREIDLTHLRRSIGVVLQDSFLFRGTIRENIAVGAPEKRLEDVTAAARTAGALEFIETLPKRFDTLVEENGSNLSGGQRQRLAIARALLNDPRLLIFDEATSALDPDSEAIFRANLAAISAGRTVILVTHRISSLVRADQILVLERGAVVDIGSHQQLLQRCKLYQHLWSQQTIPEA